MSGAVLFCNMSRTGDDQSNLWHLAFFFLDSHYAHHVVGECFWMHIYSMFVQTKGVVYELQKKKCISLNTKFK